MEDWSNGTVVLTDYQEAGRGRRGRGWLAPPQTSLLFSILFQAGIGKPLAGYIMMAALAVADGVSDATGIQPELKWPNDLLVGDRKLCGILAESSRTENGVRVVLGVGLNVNTQTNDSEALPPNSTTLQRETGRVIDRESLAVAIFGRFDLWYRDLIDLSDRVYSVWASRLGMIGCPIVVQDGKDIWEGTAVGVLRDGGLQVRDRRGALRTVYAADVSVRSPNGFTST